MTPFGLKMREWRRKHNRTQQQQATFLGVSKSYISALETGARGQPSAFFVDQICVWLSLIWDDAEDLKRLASLSHPKPSIDVRGQTADAVYLSNFLAQNIDRLSPEDCRDLIEEIEHRTQI
jgi:transcriptional regulator with XRE-family HTH domain